MFRGQLRLRKWWLMVGMGCALFIAANILEPGGVFHRSRGGPSITESGLFHGLVASVNGPTDSSFAAYNGFSQSAGTAGVTQSQSQSAAVGTGSALQAMTPIATKSAMGNVLVAGAAGRQVVESASLQLSMPRPTSALSTISNVVDTDSGYIASLSQSGVGKTFTLSIDARVPEADFHSAITQLQKLGRVNSLNETGQDVTDTLTKMAQNLSELTAERAAYTRLYKRASTMADMLKIQQALTRVQSQITNQEQSQTTLKKQVAYSSISVTVASDASPVPGTMRRPNAVVQAMRSSASAMLHSLVALLQLVAWLLPWAVVATVVWLIVRKLRRVRKPNQ